MAIVKLDKEFDSVVIGYKKNIASMSQTDIEDKSTALKKSKKTTSDKLNRSLFLIGQKSLTKKVFDVLLNNVEYDHTLDVPYTKPKLVGEEIVNIDMVKHQCHIDMTMSDMLKFKGLLVDVNLIGSESNESLILICNKQNQQINSILEGTDLINPIKTDYKIHKTNIKDRDIGLKYKKCNKFISDISVLNFKIESAQLEIDKRIAQNHKSTTKAISDMELKYGYSRSIKPITQSNDKEIVIDVIGESDKVYDVMVKDSHDKRTSKIEDKIIAKGTSRRKPKSN